MVPFRPLLGLLFFFVLALTVGGCAATRGPERDAGSDRNSLSADQLSVVSGTNLYDALQRVRPLWLFAGGDRARSVRVPTETIVLADGKYFGNLGSLRELPVAGVRRIRHLSGPEAANAYPGYPGGRHIEAAIVVEYGSNPD